MPGLPTDSAKIPEHEGTIMIRFGSKDLLSKDGLKKVIFEDSFKSNTTFTLVRDDDYYLKFVRKNLAFGSRVSQIDIKDFIGLDSEGMIFTVIITWSKEHDSLYFSDAIVNLSSNNKEVNSFNLGDLDINDASSLLESVKMVLNNRLKHEIESRNLYEPFWDNIGTSKMHPKMEIHMQSVIRGLIVKELEDVGVTLTKESDEGVGNLDFKCTYNRGSEIFRVHIEVKLAHSKDKYKGLEVQLPVYMEADKCKHGIYLVLWFKDNKHFNKPRESIEEFRSKLIKIESLLVDKSIEIIVINATKKVSASKRI